MGPQAGDEGPVKRWFQRWKTKERRKAPRQQVPGLVAYYWDGGTAAAHGVREIGPAGMFLVTDRRWYPGTVITMTLQRNDVKEIGTECAITVQARVVRQEKDGVGFALVALEARNSLPGQARDTRVADKKSLEVFLKSFPVDSDG